MTVKARLVLWLNDHGLSISAFNQYLTVPCLPSNDVEIPLENKNYRYINYAHTTLTKCKLVLWESNHF